VVGADGKFSFVDAFEGRRQLIGYFHMGQTRLVSAVNDGGGSPAHAARSSRVTPPAVSGLGLA
jgi:hypothetical protein